MPAVYAVTGTTVRRRTTANTEPTAANIAATTNATRHPGPSTNAPASAAPTAIPPTNAVIGHVYASVRIPGGATPLTSSLRVASSGAMQQPAGITSSAITGTEGAAAAAGVLLAIWSVGSAIGGLSYGLLPRRAGLQRTHLLVGALLPITLLPLAGSDV